MSTSRLESCGVLPARRSRGLRPARRRRALTLPELLVSVAIMAAVILMVAQVFATASAASGRTVAHNELLDASQTIESALRADIESMAAGLLVIYSPCCNTTAAFPGEPAGPINAALPANIEDFPDVAPTRPSDQGVGLFGNPPRRTRADMLSFISTGRQHCSWWLRVPVGGGSETLVRPDALVTYAHGVTPPAPIGNLALPATDARSWDWCRRAVLLDVPQSTVISIPGSTVLPPVWGNLSMLPVVIRDGRMDAVTTTKDEIINGTASATPAFSASIGNMLARNVVWPTLTDPVGMDETYWRRQCFRFMPRVGSVIIEWTDGSLADPFFIASNPNTYVPGNPAVKWFGRPRDVNFDGDLLDPEDVITQAQYFAWAESIDANQQFTVNTGVDSINLPAAGDYVAIWNRSNWEFRPKALRFTYRLYDATQRIRNVEPWPPPPSSVQATLPVTTVENRYGLEFSLVVPVP